MTRRTRYFMFGSVAVLLLGLCTGLVAYYAGLPMGAFGQTDMPDELVYVPPDAALVAYADVRDVMQSELRQRIRRAVPHKEEGQAEFERETGINIERDIDHVVAYLVPTGEAGEEHGYQGMLLARGDFDIGRLEQLARQHGGEVEEYKGHRIISRRFEAEQGRDVTVAFLADDMIAVGDTSRIKDSIDLTGARNVTHNTELMNLIRDIDDGNAWAVGRFDALMTHARLPEGVAQQIPAVRWFAASGQVNGGLTGVVRAETRDEQAGQNLREVVQGFLALARMQAGSKPEMQMLVNSLQLSGSGKTVALSFSVPADVFESFEPRGGAPHVPEPPEPPEPPQPDAH
jgi:hypothetical protein